MPSASLLGYKVDLVGEWPAAERSLRARFARPSLRAPDLTVHFYRRKLPARAKAPGIQGVGFRIDPDTRTLHYRLPEREPLVERRLLFVRAIAYTFSIAPVDRRPCYVLALHASGVEGPKGALVFCGYSTYGKSTISGLLAQRYPLVGDDMVMLFCRRGRRGKRPHFRALFFERLTPEWFGKRQARRGRKPWALPVAGLFWLQKDPAFSLEEMGQAEAAASILPPVGLTAMETSRKLYWTSQLTDTVPCMKLKFAKDAVRVRRFLKRSGFL